MLDGKNPSSSIWIFYLSEYKESDMLLYAYNFVSSIASLKRAFKFWSYKELNPIFYRKISL